MTTRPPLAMPAVAAAIACAGAACGTDAAKTDGSAIAPAGLVADGGGVDAQSGACAAGTWRVTDGHCEAAGVPPAQCGAGFTADGARGCKPILPTVACDEHSFARPGESTCREVGDCGGDARWGAIPAGPGTVYVDGAAPASGADGTAAHPWTTVQDGVDHAPDGAIVGIAAGTYTEHVVVARAATLRGRCPRLTTIVEPDSDPGPVVHARATTGSVGLSDLTLLGSTEGFVGAAPHVTVDRVIVRAGDRSVLAVAPDASRAPVALAIHDSLLAGTIAAESTPEVADVRVDGPLAVEIAGTVLRSGPFVGGFSVIGGTPEDSTVDVTGSIFDSPSASTLAVQNVYAHITGSLFRVSADGVYVIDGVAAIEGAVIDGTPLDPLIANGAAFPGIHGFDASIVVDGVTIHDVNGPGIEVEGGGSLAVRATQIVHAEGCGVFADGLDDVVLERVSVEDTTDTSQPAGICANAQPTRRFDVQGADIRGGSIGVFFTDGTASIEGTRVSGVRSDANGAFGDGFDVVSIAQLAHMSIEGCSVEMSARAGVGIFGADVAIGTTSFADCGIDLDGERNRGADFVLQDLGGNACVTQEDAHPCVVLSTQLTPPQPRKAPPAR